MEFSKQRAYDLKATTLIYIYHELLTDVLWPFHGWMNHHGYFLLGLNTGKWK